jgi:hypothetical protein
MKFLNYWAYGLRVASEMEFPELYASFEDGIPDLRIHLRSINLLEGKIDENATYSFKSQENKFYVHVKSVAFYEISNGINITIYPYQDALISDIRVYCLSNAFAAALHQRKIMPLHAGAIIIDDKLSLIMGNTGSGKSTLLFHLMQKGYKVFSDDVVVVLNKKASIETRATSSYPMIKLWKHQMTCMGLDNGQQVRSGVDKFPFLFHENFDIHARKIEKIIILKVDSGLTTCAVRKLKGVESVVLLFNQIYRKEYLNKAEYFSSLSLLSSMANNIPCYEIIRPMVHSTEIELANLFTKI